MTRLNAPGPAVVLLHGWTLDHRLWRRQILDLGPRLPAAPDPARHPDPTSPHLGGPHVIAYDMRGHGRSSAITRHGATLSRLADDLAAVIRQRTRPGQPVVLVGHSLGGMTIFEYAHRHPRQFAARVRGRGGRRGRGWPGGRTAGSGRARAASG